MARYLLTVSMHYVNEWLKILKKIDVHWKYTHRKEWKPKFTEVYWFIKVAIQVSTDRIDDLGAIEYTQQAECIKLIKIENIYGTHISKKCTAL